MGKRPPRCSEPVFCSAFGDFCCWIRERSRTLPFILTSRSPVHLGVSCFGGIDECGVDAAIYAAISLLGMHSYAAHTCTKMFLDLTIPLDRSPLFLLSGGTDLLPVAGAVCLSPLFLLSLFAVAVVRYGTHRGLSSRKRGLRSGSF